MLVPHGGDAGDEGADDGGAEEPPVEAARAARGRRASEQGLLHHGSSRPAVVVRTQSRKGKVRVLRVGLQLYITKDGKVVSTFDD